MRNLDDATVATAIREYGGRAMTYVIANVLKRAWSTDQVRRHLKGMERRGLVKRVPTVYATQICWALTDGGTALGLAGNP
jgi:hypothetical protein